MQFIFINSQSAGDQAGRILFLGQDGKRLPVSVEQEEAAVAGKNAAPAGQRLCACAPDQNGMRTERDLIGTIGVAERYLR